MTTSQRRFLTAAAMLRMMVEIKMTGERYAPTKRFVHISPEDSSVQCSAVMRKGLL